MIETKRPAPSKLPARHRLALCAGLALGFTFTISGALAQAAHAEHEGPAVEAASIPIAVSVVHRDGTVVIRANAVVYSDPATAWKVLTDYDRYASLVPGLRASRVVSRQGHHVVVEQDGVAPMWLLRVPVDVVYHITEYPPVRLASRAIADAGTTLDSEYRLTPDPRGVRLDYMGTLAARPGVLAALREDAGEHAIVEHFGALAKAMEREARIAGFHESDSIDSSRR